MDDQSGRVIYYVIVEWGYGSYRILPRMNNGDIQVSYNKFDAPSGGIEKQQNQF